MLVPSLHGQTNNSGQREGIGYLRERSQRDEEACGLRVSELQQDAGRAEVCPSCQEVHGNGPE